MSLLYVFAAAAFEAKPVRQIAASAKGSDPASAPLRCGANELLLVTGGMGPKLAQKAAEAALGSETSKSRKPDAVLIIGLCGGLTESLPEGRIVVYTDCLSTEAAKAPLRCSPSLTDSFVSLLASSSIQCDRVAGITSPRIATKRVERVELARSGAAVIDMESYPIVQAFATAGIPAVILRVVSDSLDRDLPDFNRALNEAGSLDGRRALKIALRSPLQTANLLAANKRAMKQLSKALEVVLPAQCFA